MNQAVKGINFFTSVNQFFGAGVAGKGFALNLEPLTDVRLEVSPAALSELETSEDAERRRLYELARKPVLPQYPSLVRGGLMNRRWIYPDDWPLRTSDKPGHGLTVGHIFFEFDQLLPEELAWMDGIDLLTTGSQWTTDIAQAHGLKRVATLYQGVDRNLFKPNPFWERPARFDDRFVVFSGGKIEHRKGTDLVIAAFARFIETHPDALLLINAYNPWPISQMGLAESPHIHFDPVADYPADMKDLLLQNQIPRENFLVIPPVSRAEIAGSIWNSDCGLFPIRCEGGTNHFLMETMACGKPVIATHTSGLTEIIRPEHNAIGLEARHPVTPAFQVPEPERGIWHEPDVDEIVAALERLYTDRELGKKLGTQAAADLDFFSWPNRAQALLNLIAEHQ
ncbi:MAG: glycosyltransferase family 4 protein [Acidobacteriota bacterium]|nr:glycosyltransferase family 4 protein [Acidobacteriota bacterium]